MASRRSFLKALGFAPALPLVGKLPEVEQAPILKPHPPPVVGYGPKRVSWSGHGLQFGPHPPSVSAEGNLFYDTTEGQLLYYDGNTRRLWNRVQRST